VAPSTLQISLLNVDAESYDLTFPPDHNRPELVPGQVLLGPGIESSTLIQSVLGNNKFVIPASASSKTLLEVNTVNTDPGVAVSNPVGTAGATTFTSTGTLKVGMAISGNGIPDGTVITAVTPAVTPGSPATYTLSNALTANMTTATVVEATNVIKVKDIIGLTVGMVFSLPQGFAPNEKVRIKSINGSANPPTITLDKTPTTVLSNLTAVAAGDKTLEAGTSNIFLADITGIKAGQPVSGDGIPAGTFVGEIGLGESDGFGNRKIPLVDANGEPRYIPNSSYSAISLAFDNQRVTLNKRPMSDTFDATDLSVSTEYSPASKIGDLKVSFTEGSDFSYYGTDGVKLSGIPLEAARASGPRIRTFNVGTNGQVNVILSNGQTFSGGSVLLQSFKDPGALIREGDNLFSGIYTAGPYNGNWDENNIRGLTAGGGGLGSINGGALELSNVDIGEEFSTMITTQRAFQAGSRVISTADQMLEEAVNLKR
jgi:flagellar hook protein FlgE